MAKERNKYDSTKFSVETIKEAIKTFDSNLPKDTLLGKEETQLILRFEGGKEKEFGKDREAFYRDYQKDNVVYAFLDSSRVKEPGINYRLVYEPSSTDVTISLPSLEKTNSVIKVFENSLEESSSQSTEEEVEESNNQSIDSQDLIYPLINGLVSTNPDTRANSADMLGSYRGERSIAALSEALYSEKDDNVKRKIVEALGKFNNPQVIPPLRHALKDENTITRHLAVQTLGNVGDTRVINDLVEMMGDSEPDIQNSAKEALVKIEVRDLRIKNPDIEDQPKDELYNLLKENEAYLQNEDGTPIALEDASTSLPEGLTPEGFNVALRSLADNSSEIDLLDYEDYAKALVDFISSAETEKPLTIGIDAAWGVGKTTLMGMVKDRLKNNFYTVWFNAWKYDQEKSLWSALILETLSQIRKEFSIGQRIMFWLNLNWNRIDRKKFRDILAKNISILLLFATVISIVIASILNVFWPEVTLKTFIESVFSYPAQIGLLAAFTLIWKIFKETKDLIAGPFNLNIRQYLKNPDYEEQVGFLNQLDEDFRTLVSLITKNGKKPLVVFIDDLDRCAPPNPAQIFEAINLLIGAKHCVFIIGMDSHTVARSIEAKYKDLIDYFKGKEETDGLSLGYRFIEKIVQINFHIPKSEPQTIEQFIVRSLGAEETSEEKPSEEVIQEVEFLIESEQRTGTSSLDEVIEVVKNIRGDISEEVLSEARQNVFAKSFDDSPEVEAAIIEASQYLEANPRKIKRFINLFRLKSLIANRRGLIENREIQLNTLAKIIVLEMCWPEIYEAYLTDEEFKNRLQRTITVRKTQVTIEFSQFPEKDWDRLQKELEILTSDNRIKSIANARELHKLIEELPTSLSKLLPYTRLGSGTL